MTITSRIAELNARDPKTRYWAADRTRARARFNLSRTADPAERVVYLNALHKAAAVQAAVYDNAFGAQLVDGDIWMADSLSCEAMLYLLLSDVEAAAATPGRGRIWHELVDAGVARATSDLLAGTDAVLILEQMAAANLPTRQRLLLDLANAVEKKVGAEVASVLLHLPAPGFIGPDPHPAPRYLRESRPAMRAVAGALVALFVGVVALARDWESVVFAVIGISFVAFVFHLAAKAVPANPQPAEPIEQRQVGYILHCPGTSEHGHGETAATVHTNGCCDRFAALDQEMKEKIGVRYPSAG